MLLVVASARVSIVKQRLSLLTIGVTFAQMATVLQAFTAFSQMRIMWVYPVDALMVVFSSFNFNFGRLRFQCAFQHDDYATGYLLKLVFFPLLSFCMFVTWAILKILRRPFPLSYLLNMNGTIFVTLFINLTLNATLPFQCRLNPNGTRTMLSAPGVTCWDGSADHTKLVFLGVLSFLCYPTFLLSGAAWITYRYPAILQTAKGLATVNTFRFLFQNYRPECYYCVMLFLVRNLMMALLPVALISYPIFQVFFMVSALLLSVIGQSLYWPFRSVATNVLEIALSSTLVMILLCVMPLVDTDPSTLASILGAMIMSLICALFVAIFGAFLLAFWKQFVPSKQFGIFLCHHKMAAGALCRLLKILIAHQTSMKVFLDSDELENLDNVFETVKSNTQNLVVVLTPEVLSRMWCAGEIVTAFQNELRVIPLLCDDFQFLNEDLILKVDEYFLPAQKQTSHSYGISIDMIKDSYRSLGKLEVVTLSRLSSLGEIEQTTQTLLQRCACGRSRSFFVLKITSSKEPAILILGSNQSAEVLAVCQVLQTLTQESMLEETAVIQDESQAKRWLLTAFYIVVVLSKGILFEPSFARVLLIAHKFDFLEYVNMNLDSTFEFPSLSFYDQLESDECTFAAFTLSERKELIEIYRSLLSVLALPLTAWASNGLLNLQVSQMCRRLRLKDHEKLAELQEKRSRSLLFVKELEETSVHL